jgi:hypothetical protein
MGGQQERPELHVEVRRRYDVGFALAEVVDGSPVGDTNVSKRAPRICFVFGIVWVKAKLLWSIIKPLRHISSLI